MAKHQTIHTVLVCLLWSILPCGMSAQSQNRNYVLTRVMQSADGSRHQESIGYSDGLGRPVEQVAVKASPTGKDIVTLIEYEGLDREKRTWLPVIGNSDGSYLTPADFRSRATSCAFYGNDE